MKRDENSKKIGIISALVGGVFWGLSGVCGQYLFLNYGISARWLVSVRLVVAGILLLIPTIVGEKSKVFNIWKDRKNFASLLFFSIFGMGMCQLSYYSAVELSNAGIATVIQYTAPVMIFGYYALKVKNIPTRKEVVALIMAMTGVFLLTTGGNIGTFNISTEAFIWALISAVMMAVFNIVPVDLMKKYGAACVTGWGMLIAGIILSAYVQPWNIDEAWDTKAFMALAVVIVVGTVFSFLLYMYGVKLIGGKKASLIASVEPLTATIATMTIMDIPFSWVEILGMCTVIIAVLLLAKSEKK